MPCLAIQNTPADYATALPHYTIHTCRLYCTTVTQVDCQIPCLTVTPPACRLVHNKAQYCGVCRLPMAMPELQCDVWDEDKTYKVLLYDVMWCTPFKGEIFKMLRRVCYMERVRLCRVENGVFMCKVHCIVWMLGPLI